MLRISAVFHYLNIFCLRQGMALLFLQLSNALPAPVIEPTPHPLSLGNLWGLCFCPQQPASEVTPPKISWSTLCLRLSDMPEQITDFSIMSSVLVPVAFVFLNNCCFTWRSWTLSAFLAGFLFWLFEYLWRVDIYPFLPLNHNYGPWFQTDILEISRWFVSSLFSFHLALFYLFSHHILSRYFFIWESCAASATICVEKPMYLYDKAATTMYILLIYVTTATE